MRFFNDKMATLTKDTLNTWPVAAAAGFQLTTHNAVIDLRSLLRSTRDADGKMVWANLRMGFELTDNGG